MNKFKLVKVGEGLRKDVLSGAKIAIDIISPTLGPYGKNFIFEKQGTIRIVNDGVTAAREITALKDEFPSLGSQAVAEACIKTSEAVGDGTTSTAVFVGAILKDVVGLGNEESVFSATRRTNMKQAKDEIDAAYKIVIEKLKAMAKPVKDKTELENVAIMACEDEVMGKIVADMVEKVGIDGFVSVDEGFKEETESEIIEGMQFFGTYIAEELVNTPYREARWEESPIIVFGGQIDSYYQVNDLIRYVVEHMKKNKLVIIADSFAKDIVPLFAGTTKNTPFKLLGIKAPSRTTEELEDVAIYTGACFYNPSKGDKISFEKLSADYFGKAEKITADRDNVMIIGGGGSKSVIEDRIKTLKEQLPLEEDITQKNRMKRRIASLSRGIGVIRIGSNTDVEKHYQLKKIDNAVHSVKAAMEEGIVRGGGLAFVAISEELPEGNVLKNVLLSINKQLVENAGGEFEVAENIYDAVKVLRIALQNACNLAGRLITIWSAAAWKRNTLEEELRNVANDQSQL